MSKRIPQTINEWYELLAKSQDAKAAKPLSDTYNQIAKDLGVDIRITEEEAWKMATNEPKTED